MPGLHHSGAISATRAEETGQGTYRNDQARSQRGCDGACLEFRLCRQRPSSGAPRQAGRHQIDTSYTASIRQPEMVRHGARAAMKSDAEEPGQGIWGN
nr:DUF680 domain-containing protein [Mesorhizobium sp. B2-4-14]